MSLLRIERAKIFTWDREVSTSVYFPLQRSRRESLL
jgi:hypothetical protein